MLFNDVIRNGWFVSPALSTPVVQRYYILTNMKRDRVLIPRCLAGEPYLRDYLRLLYNVQLMFVHSQNYEGAQDEARTTSAWKASSFTVLENFDEFQRGQGPISGFQSVGITLYRTVYAPVVTQTKKRVYEVTNKNKTLDGIIIFYFSYFQLSDNKMSCRSLLKWSYLQKGDVT